MEIKSYKNLSALVLEKLLNGERLTQQQFLQHGSWRLAAIIWYQKSRGIKIEKKTLARRAAEYFLTTEEILRIKKTKKNKK